MATRAGTGSDALALGEVVSRLGPGLVTVAVAPNGSLDQPVCGVCVNDPLLELSDGSGHVLLAVGVDVRRADAVDFVRRAAAKRYAAVVLHADELLADAVVEAARPLRSAVLTAPTDVSWVHLATMFRVSAGSPSSQQLAGVPLGDLFAFANSLAARVGGAVTIEDPQSHVLAYSGVANEVDEPRRETILGRQVPQRYMRVLQERGIFRRLLTSEDVVHMDAVPEVQLSRRVAISVRAAGELLGSIWVAETGRPLAPEYEEILREAAPAAALHIMRHQLHLLAEDELRRSMLHDLLGGRAADVAALRLALDPAACAAVVAFEGAGAGGAARLTQVMTLYCSAVRPSAVAADAGPRVYVVLTGEKLEGKEVRQFAADGARRAASALQLPVHAAIGRVVGSVGRVVESRNDADRVMRVLLGPEAPSTVADIDDVRAQANLLEVLDLVRERPQLQEGGLQRLDQRADDRSRPLLITLRAYLDHSGDVTAAAAAMHVHPNTFRYRLRRACELADLHLEDPTERLMLALQLRVHS